MTNLTITSTTPGSRTGAGVVTLNATTSGGNIKWYDAASGGTLLATRASGSAWQTSSISTTTTYYVEADDGTCTSASRSAVTASVVNPPGGVGTNLLLWMKADAEVHNSGTTLATDGQDVDNWHDQSGNNHDATTGTDPHWDEDAFNFNPAVHFTAASNEYLSIPSGIFGAQTLTGVSAYAVTGHTSGTGAGAVFSEPLTSEDFMFLAPWSTDDIYWQVGSDAVGSGRATDGTWEGTSDGSAHLWGMGNNSSNSTSAGEEQYIRLNGKVVDTQDGYDASAVSNNSNFYIGYWDRNSYEMNGPIAELVVYDKILTATEEIQVQSYLAIKYGITLSNDNDANSTAGEIISGSITEGDYLAADGSTVVWDYSANSAYHYDVAGIGADATTGLDQRISKSYNSDAIVTMCTEAIGTLNSGISTALTDDTYLLWGNNDGSTSASADLPSGYTGRLEKEWVVEMTGTVSNVHVQFDIVNGQLLPGDAAGDYFLLTDADGDFTSGATATAASSFSNGKVTFDDVNFTDGQYFTLASQQAAPGGVAANLELWLKADAEIYEDASPGTDAAEDGDDVLQWHDQSTFSHDATVATGNYPNFEDDEMNFNPCLNFTVVDGEYLAIENGLFGTETRDEMTSYIVIQQGSSSNLGTFGEELANSEDFMFLSFWNSDMYYQLGSDSEGSGRLRDYSPTTSTTSTLGQKYIYSMGSGADDNTPGGQEQYLRVNGYLEDAQDGYDASATGNGSDFLIGKWSTSNEFHGKIAELIVYNGIPSVLDELQIQTYLAIKYGITLTNDNDADASAGETVSGSITEGDYVNSDGSTVIWDYSAYSSYHYDIAGLGRDDNQGLHQKQSKSVNSDAIVTMSTEAIGTTNAGISTALTDGTYLLWGNNNASTSANTDLPSGYTGRLEKEWVVEMTGTVSNVHVEFDISSNGLAGDAAADYYLLIDADGDFTSGASATAASSFSTGKVTFDDVNFTDGQYFTLATQQTAPGGEATNLLLWLKADAQTYEDASPGTDAAEDADDILQWHDQSGLSHDATVATGSYPHYDEDAFNFNPGLVFTQSSSEYLQISGGIFDANTITGASAYVVCSHESGTYSAVFSEPLTGSDEFMFLAQWNTDDSYWQVGSGTVGSGRSHDGGWGASSDGTQYIWSMGNNSSNATSGGEEQYIRVNGHMEDQQNGYDATATGDNNDFYIGKWTDNTNEFNGTMAELIVYDKILSATEEIKVQSYLALKYGITLNADNDTDDSFGEIVTGTLHEGDYLAADGTTEIWDYSANSAYHNDVAGIGADATSGLDQRISKSRNSDAIVTMCTEAIGTLNSGISTALTDDTYLLWGNNNSTSNAYDDLPAGYSGRLKKEWVVEMTGTVENVHVEFDLTNEDYLGGDAATDFYLLVDADGDFTSGASEIAASSFSSNKVTFNDIDFTDGQYFTLATQQPGPGGVANNVLLWLKADAGTNTTTNDERVTSWVSQGNSSFTANEVSSDGPTYKTDGINGHPALDFSDNRMNITGGICEGETKDDIFVYVVSLPRSVNSQRVIFWQNLNSTRYLLLRQHSSSYAIQFIYGTNQTSKGGAHANEATAGIVADQAHLWSIGSTRGDANTTPNGTRRYIKRNGVVVESDDNSSETSGTSTNDFQIGHHSNASYYDGLIAEIIILDETPTAKQDNRIRSYLNNKYGLTNGATSQDRINSNGTTIWPYNASYNTNIAGIRRDDLSGVDEKQAKSILSGAVVTMSTQAIAATNAANTTSLSVDKSALVWGNDAGSVAMQTSELHSEFSERLGREWLVQETGTVGDVVVEVDLTGVSFSNTHVKNFGLVIDDDGDFTGGTQSWIGADTYSSNKVTFNAVNFSNGDYFTVMNTPNALPVELLYFEGKRVGSHVLLEWETLAEVNNDYFIVEKSTDGENWEEILTVDGQGNISQPTYYSQIDIDGCVGICYYRLIQVDFDGQRAEPEVLVLKDNTQTPELAISVSPNPINQIAHIAFVAPDGGVFTLNITTQTGKLIYSTKILGDEGNNHTSYHASFLSSGSYYFILEDDKGNRTQQLVIK